MDELVANGSFTAGNVLDDDNSISNEYLSEMEAPGKAGQPVASLHMTIVSKKMFAYSTESLEYESKLWSQLIYGRQVSVTPGCRPMYLGGKKLSKLFGNLSYSFNPDLYGIWEPTVTIASGIRPDLIQEMEKKEDVYKSLVPIFGISSVIVCFIDSVDVPNGEIMQEFFKSVKLIDLGTPDRAINVIFALVVDERHLKKSGDSYNIKASAAELSKPVFAESLGIRVKMCPIVSEIQATWDFLYTTIGATLESVTKSKHLRDGEDQVNLIKTISEAIDANDFAVRVKTAKDQKMDSSANRMAGWVRDRIIKPLTPKIKEMVAMEQQTIINKELSDLKKKAKDDFFRMIFPCSEDLRPVSLCQVEIGLRMTQTCLEMQAKKPMAGPYGRLRDSILHVMVQKIIEYREMLMKDAVKFSTAMPDMLQQELYQETMQWMMQHNMTEAPKEVMLSIRNLIDQYLQNTLKLVEEKWTTRKFEVRAFPDRNDRNYIRYETRSVTQRYRTGEVQGDWHLVKREERSPLSGAEQCLLL